MRDDRDYLGDILQCISQIESYTLGGQAEFLQTQMIQDAVIRNFEIIGEATKRLSPTFKQKYPDIQWRQIAGFRDVLIHDYIYVDSNEIWNIVEQNLPELKSRILAILEALGEEP